MKKLINLLFIFFVLISIPSFCYAQTKNKNDIPNGTYVIGTYMFTKEKNTNYNGALTTPMIMLASKSINSNNLNDMIIYYKNSRGKWVNAINNKIITNVPNTFNITCENLLCQNDINSTINDYEEQLSSKVGNGVYIIGTYMFTKEKNTNYNGTLTTPMIMLASKSITSNNLNDMVIYYKNSRGKWINAINNRNITNVPLKFNITYANLIKKDIPKQDDIINFIYKSIVYSGDSIEALVSAKSDLPVSVEYYSDSTCQTKINPPTIPGKYYIKATTTGNNNYKPATLSCTEAINIKKITLSCPNIMEYNGYYDKNPHSILVSNPLHGTVEYKVGNDDWVTTNPTRIEAGKTIVNVRILGNEFYETIDCGSADINISKINDNVSVLSASYVYDGHIKEPDTIHVVSGLNPIITYYSDNKCSIETTTLEANEVGGAPFAIGKYYLSISTAGNQNYNSYAPACFEAVTITAEKVDDVLFIEEQVKNYTGLPIGTFFGSKSGLPVAVTYYTDSGCQNMTPATSEFEQGHAPINAGIYYVITSTEGNNNYNQFTSECTRGVTINKKKSTISLNETEGNINYPSSKDVTITYEGDGILSCSTSDDNIATCLINDKILTITPINNFSEAREVTITVSMSEGINYLESEDVLYNALVS